MSEIKDRVIVNFDVPYINVNNDPLPFSFTREHLKNLPSEVSLDNIQEIYWEKDKQSYFTLYGGSLVLFEESKYNDFIQPYVDLWQAEKNRIEQEQQEAQEQYNQIQNVRARAITYMNNTWGNIEETANVESSLGYTIGVSEKDIKFYTARIETMDDTETVTFKDYHNIERTGVTKANFVTMRKEAYAKYLNLLNIKSEYEANIEQCSTKEQVISLISQLNVFNPSLAPVTDI